MPFVTSPSVPARHENHNRGNGAFALSASSSTFASFERPIPRPPRSPGAAGEICKRNRRRAYLEQRPDYFDNSEHELAAPLLYDSLIRTFQTPAEREAEGKRKGYSGVLEADLLRGEARLAKLASEPNEETGPSQNDRTASSPDSADVLESNARPNRASSAFDPDLPTPHSKEEAKSRWIEFLTDRFVHGQDDDFNYDAVDLDDSYDVLERRDAEDAWFEEEQPRWASEPEDDEEYPRAVKMGETGIQDF
ncbi:hypothetical protein SODALDRAFT_343519 [Sodiomyces alkalinus F11]|uniref:CCD97-like C-terminal domain-containing protein n=1 Tax=Sodiomyces alkalinus (strain CBS 110278 / VKM F-3762 / F11) TaxID=1314773 RepID=A0A3N2Q4N0_SODAK|nr:hypothetical protein SODALDRAFT_343519 [Sodiomyces alkalinus F11]ROT41666.1 hypothetical protein SODALDRAFT_343519 [Sodiomyces alkalinus F11]